MFSIVTSNDLLEKARRELEKYRKQPNSDNIFNLFVTIRHIEDYAKNNFATRKTRKKFHNKVKSHFGGLYDWMRFICNKQKHCKIEKEQLQIDMDNNHRQIYYSAAINGAPLNELPINGNNRYYISYMQKKYELDNLASTLIQKWEDII